MRRGDGKVEGQSQGKRKENEMRRNEHMWLEEWRNDKRGVKKYKQKSSVLVEHVTVNVKF